MAVEDVDGFVKSLGKQIEEWEAKLQDLRVRGHLAKLELEDLARDLDDRFFQLKQKLKEWKERL